MARKKKSSLGDFLIENISTSLRHSVKHKEFLLTYILDLIFFSYLFYALIQAGPALVSVFRAMAETGTLANLPSRKIADVLAVRMWLVLAAFTIYYLAKLSVYNAFLLRFDEMRRKKKVSPLSSDLVYGLKKLPVVIIIMVIMFLFSVAGSIVFAAIGKNSVVRLFHDVYSILLSLGFLLSVPYAVLKRTDVIESVKKSWRVFLNNPLELLVIYICGAIINLVIIFAFLIPAGFMVLKVIYPVLAPLRNGVSTSVSQAKAHELMISIIKAILQNKATVFVAGCIFIAGTTLSFLFYTSYIAGVFRRFEKR